MTAPVPVIGSLTGSDRGFSLVETMFALCILLVVAAGVMPLALLSIRITENSGHLKARATEYALDKLEQLMALSYGDAASDTRVFPATTGGTGLAPGGSVGTAAPVAQYVDYLTMDGALLPSVNGAVPANWYYRRTWQVEEVGTADTLRCPVAVSAARKCLKRISVTTTVRTPAQGGDGAIPRASLTALKTYPF